MFEAKKSIIDKFANEIEETRKKLIKAHQDVEEKITQLDETAKKELQKNINEIQNALSQLDGPLFDNIKNKFSQLTETLSDKATPEQVKDVYLEMVATIQDAADEGIFTAEQITTEVADNLNNLIISSSVYCGFVLS